MTNTGKGSRTQAERRAHSRRAVLDSACKLFGARGYADTSLEEIAADCGLTIRPIYHYFGNKKALFAAVNEVMEQRIVDSLEAQSASMAEYWSRFLQLCEDPGFRRIVLIDSPNILGRERWNRSIVTQTALATFAGNDGKNPRKRFRANLFNRVTMGAFAEAALAVADAEDVAMARVEAEQLMAQLFDGKVQL